MQGVLVVKKKLDTRSWIEIVLVAVAMVAWLLRKMKVLYVPALTSFALGIAMGMLGVGYIAEKNKSRKAAGVLILAFGLFNVFVGIMEIYGNLNGI